MLIEQVNDVSDFPNAVGDSRFHRGGDSERFVNPAEIVVHDPLRGLGLGRTDITLLDPH
jgi:hypothetical protein